MFRHTLTTVVFLLTASPAAAQDVLVGDVERVVDGDTIDVRLDSGLVRVRLHGLDAPERAQPFGAEASESLRRLVGGRMVELEPVEQDRYDRMVARVYVDGNDANAEMIRRGMGYAYRSYLRQLEGTESYCEFEHTARQSESGIWRLTAEQRIAPWEWRRGRRDDFTDYSGETVADCLAAVAQPASRSRSSPFDDGSVPDSAPMQCGARRTCDEIASCAEAMFYLKQCGLTSLDRDGDSIPCEDKCP